jgi:hypothetical protein
MHIPAADGRHRINLNECRPTRLAPIDPPRPLARTRARDRFRHSGGQPLILTTQADVDQAMNVIIEAWRRVKSKVEELDNSS